MTTNELITRVYQRLDQTPGGYYTPGEVLGALNEAQRLFALLTLCLETTAALPLEAATPFYRLLTVSGFSLYLLPLRVRVAGAGGAKVTPARLADLDALNPAWQAEPGTPARYAALGFDFLAVHPRPTGAGTSLDITFARCPAAMTSASTPEIPEEHHPALTDYAIPRLRVKEGGSALAKSMPFWEAFLAAAEKLAAYVRARNRGLGYDRVPAELTRADRARLLKAMQE